MNKIERMIDILKAYNIFLTENKIEMDGNPQYQFYLHALLYDYILPLYQPSPDKRGLPQGYNLLYHDLVLYPETSYWFPVMRLAISNKCLAKIRELETKNEPN